MCPTETAPASSAIEPLEILNRLSQPIWIFDIDAGRVHWANRSALRVWSATSLEELCGRNMRQDMSDAVARRLVQYQADFVSHHAAFNEQWTLYPAGQALSLNVRFSGHRLPDQRMAMLCEARPAEIDAPASLRSVEALLHTAVMISLYGDQGQPLYRNPAARASVCVPDETLLERLSDPRACQELLDGVERDGVATLTLAVRTAQGERWHEVSARRCRDAVTGQASLLISEADVSALKRTQAHASFLALHDVLTGLPNRSEVLRHFVAAIQDNRQVGLEAALIFIDLDRFKNVNDTLGHAAGDELLVQVAHRLRAATRSSDLVARLGGDEFLILLTGPDIHAEVEQLQLRIMQTIAEPIELLGTEVCVTPSLGVSLYPRDGADIETLLRNADLAMYTAKERGRNEVAYYEAAMTELVHSRGLLEADLRLALERDEFEVFYQALVDVTSSRIVGAEALVRWRHPVRGLVAPDVFIPLCESTGLIRPLGLRVFELAARQQVAWLQAGHTLCVSVNLSPVQFRHEQLRDEMQRILQDTGADPCRLQLEITESTLMGNDERVRDTLRAFEALGMSMALDDFGVGYSNLAYLRHFPIKTLKIDKSFIQGIDDNRPLAELIVAMCRLMKLKVVAEGVETDEQLQWVRAHQIEQFQGYLFARPLPVAEFDALLAQHTAAPTT
jgi:diguanylate cyclase (GGDEF)-like protein